MPRTVLTDKSWEKLKVLMLDSWRVNNKTDHWMTLEGILYRMRTGITWRDLLSYFAQWSAVFKRLNLRSRKDILNNIFTQLSQISDTE